MKLYEMYPTLTKLTLEDCYALYKNFGLITIHGVRNVILLAKENGQ